MPYKTINDLSENVRGVLPKHAQEIYMKAFNSAYEQYDTAAERHGDADRDETAHKVAWSAVKKAGYQKDNDGNWRKG